MDRITALLEAPLESSEFGEAFASSTADEREDVYALCELGLTLKEDELALLRLRAALDRWDGS